MTYAIRYKKIYSLGLALLSQLALSSMVLAMDQKDESCLPLANTSGMQSVKMKYYLQDPTVIESEFGLLTTPVKTTGIWTKKPILEDKDLVITTKTKPDATGNFMFSPQTASFDKASVFATVRTTMNMYRDDLGALKALYPSDNQLQNIIKYWDGVSYGKLRITPEAGIDANAYYSRSGTFRELNFFSFSGDVGMTHTCRSSDVVTHEAGHAILDILHPQFFSTNSLETGGFHESFGDQTAMFWTLNHPFLCTRLITATGGNLHQHDNNFLASLAEQFGESLGMPDGLRNADDDIELKSAEPEVHAISTVYTGAIYDVLADAYQEASYNLVDNNDKSIKLYDVGKQLRQMNLESIVALGDAPSPSFSDFAFALDTVAKRRIQSGHPTALDSLNWSNYINTQFTSRRGVPVASHANAGLNNLSVKKVRLCGTSCQVHAKNLIKDK